GLARGYLNRPELTAEKFVPNPFAVIKGERLYKTGDLVRYLEDGTIEFLGRIDNQVKVRGFRIELQEIESQMKSYEGIQEAVVVLREDRPSDKRLIGYVVMGEAKQFDSLSLQRYLRGRLPDYMIPSFIMKLDALPVTPNGKIDRKKLSESGYVLYNAEENYFPPRTATEKELATIIAGLLKKEKAGVFDNFFELGGHSLLASQLVSRIRENMGIEVPLRVIFEKPVIADMAVEIEVLREKDHAGKVESIKPISREAHKRLRSELER
ncbi:MAG: phosphopantetheine-binding protein, partial [Ignavibacteriales bacterium]